MYSKNSFIDQYLCASRGDFQIIADSENRFKYIHKMITEILSDFKSDCIFLKSALGKYELVENAGKKYCICDRQVDLYFNSFDASFFYGNENSLLESAIFIACNELFIASNPRMANEFYDHYLTDDFSNPGYDFFKEIGRQFFTIFHELGHSQMSLHDDMNISFRGLANKEFVGLFGELSFTHPEVVRFKSRIEWECAADIYAMIAGIEFMKSNDKMVSVALGTNQGYLFSALQVIIYQWAVDLIRNTVKKALFSDEDMNLERNSDNIVRLRIIRQAANQIAINELGENDALKFHNEFQNFLERFYLPFQEKIPEYIFHIVRENRISLKSVFFEKEAEVFLSKFSWK